MKIVLILIMAISLFADIKQDMFSLYQNKKYKEACNIGFDYFANNKRDEEFVSLYAFACLKSDFIDRLAAPTAVLKFTKEARANSAYFSVILMQKKLLYHALIDGYDLSSLNLPTTNYVLSKVFDLYVALGQHKARAFYLFDDKDDAKLSYKLYVIKGETLDKVVIEEYYNGTKLKQHIYW